MEKEKVVLFWSGGKDSALALKRIKEDTSLELLSLVTTIDQGSGEVPYHGVPEVLIKQQALMMGLPLIRVYLAKNCTNEQYEQKLSSYLKLFKAKGVKRIFFGDIHLTDIREYRDNLLAKFGLIGSYPLWQSSSQDLLNEFLNSGHRAIFTAIDEKKIPLCALAKEITSQSIATLPSDVDKSGENGEYHSFVSFGPYFKMRVQFSKNVTISDGPYTICKLREA